MKTGQIPLFFEMRFDVRAFGDLAGMRPLCNPKRMC
jgi:hypothetical protein